MELPFYLSCEEFKKRYYDDLEIWFENDRNATEIDFLINLSELYKPYLYYNFAENNLQVDATVKVKEYAFSSFDNFGISYLEKKHKNVNTHIHITSEWKAVSMMEYAQYVLDKINKHLVRSYGFPEKNVHDYINDYEVIASAEKVGYKLDYNTHQLLLPFLKAYLPHYGQTVDISLYKEFYISVVEIAHFIDRKLHSVKAFEHSIYCKLRSEAKMGLQMKHHFLTIFN
ncbi:hypothetical protein [Chryseobacterium sp. CT-SW4]|uniref:hypothetical protein n=1 Tax=Chryseobacterium sp. SW-1 TaxID=3157343 RepID=UPI003B0102C4